MNQKQRDNRDRKAPPANSLAMPSDLLGQQLIFMTDLSPCRPGLWLAKCSDLCGLDSIHPPWPPTLDTCLDAYAAFTGLGLTAPASELSFAPDPARS